MIPPRRVLVTGAAGAIGAAIARAMRAAWPSARLALLDRDAAAVADLARELGGELGDGLGGGPGAASGGGPGGGPGAAPGAATAHGADLRDVDALPALVRALDPPDRPDPFDGLVNCAGVMRVRRVSTWAWDDARDLLAVDLLAPLRLQDLLVRGMVERGRGVIVNVASMAGKTPLKGCTYYGAAKAGLGMASEIARAELAPHGVRVVTVYPGPVRSALEAGARADYGGGGWFGGLAPVGEAAELARRVLAAIARDEPRVVYPRVYEFGRLMPSLASWIALTWGPPPVA